ncbi:unnamed protein product [Phytomonas sp. Hart1]|nr:unnamed protein product [Phytomonas sp. Hart1]|eukprot:CCW67622.1 unnamed protein product [Phytomonas sp. isolate Hart1]
MTSPICSTHLRKESRAILPCSQYHPISRISAHSKFIKNNPCVYDPETHKAVSPVGKSSKMVLETRSLRQGDELIHTNTAFISSHENESEAWPSTSLKGALEPFSCKKETGQRKVDKNEKKLGQTPRENVDVHTNISYVRSPASVYSSIETSIVATTTSSASLNFVNPSLCPPSQPHSSPPRRKRPNPQPTNNEKDATTSPRCIFPKPPKIHPDIYIINDAKGAMEAVEQDGRITRDSRDGVNHSPPLSAHRSGLHHSMLSRDALLRSRLGFPPEASDGVVETAPNGLGGNPSRGPSPLNRKELKPQLQTTLISIFDPEDPRSDGVGVADLDSQTPRRLSNLVECASSSINNTRSFKKPTAHGYPENSPLCGSSFKKDLPNPKIHTPVPPAIVDIVSSGSANDKTDYISHGREVVQKKSVKRQLYKNDKHTHRTRASHPFIRHLDSSDWGGIYPLGGQKKCVEEDDKAEEARRLRRLQKYHHDLDVIQNGGREVVKSDMKSSADLTRSLSHFRNWSRAVQDGLFTFQSLFPSPRSSPTSAAIDRHDVEYREGECQGEESPEGHSGKSPIEAAFPVQSPAFQREKPDDDRLLFRPIPRGKKSSITFEIEQSPISDSSMSDSSTDSDWDLPCQKQGAFLKSKSIPNTPTAILKYKTQYKNPSKSFNDDAEEEDEDLKCFSFYSYGKKIQADAGGGE